MLTHKRAKCKDVNAPGYLACHVSRQSVCPHLLLKGAMMPVCGLVISVCVAAGCVPSSASLFADKYSFADFFKTWRCPYEKKNQNTFLHRYHSTYLKPFCSGRTRCATCHCGVHHQRRSTHDTAYKQVQTAALTIALAYTYNQHTPTDRTLTSSQRYVTDQPCPTPDALVACDWS